MKPIDDRSIRSIRSAVMAAALSIGLGFVTHVSAKSYLIDFVAKTAIDLGNVQATAINNAGQVVGASYAADGRGHAFITGPNGMGMRDLGTPPGAYSSYASGINNAGQVAGGFTTADKDDYKNVFITGPNGVGMTALGTQGKYYSIARAINNAGQVVGDLDSRAFITGPNGVGMTDLGTLGGVYGEASGINDTGQVVGSFLPADHGQHAFIAGPNGVGMIDLGTLPRSHVSRATDINNAGRVVGLSYESYGDSGHAFITGPNGVGMTDLGTLGGGFSYAFAINDAGQAVGFSSTAVKQSYNGRHAFITGPNGVGMTDLNSLVHLPDGLVMMEAIDINNMGQVLVFADIPPAIPEPESYALMLAGLVLTGVMVRRKQKADALEGVLGV